MYIERSLAIARMLGWGEPALTDREIKALLEEIPAAEVVPVVRCRDCMHSDDAWVNEKGFLICPASGMDISGDDFCSYGERRDSDGKDDRH